MASKKNVKMNLVFLYVFVSLALSGCDDFVSLPFHGKFLSYFFSMFSTVGSRKPILFAVDDRQKVSLLNSKGELIATSKWDDFSEFDFWFNPGPQDLIPVNIGCSRSPSKSWDCSGGKWGYIDRNGAEVIPFQFDKASLFDGPVASVTVGAKVGLIDKNGKFVLNPTYERLFTCKDGLNVAGTNDKVGYIRPDGSEVISPQFAFAGCFMNGFADVTFETVGTGSERTWGKTGLIDRSGKIALSPIWKSLQRLSDAPTFFAKGDDDKWRLIDSAGNQVGSGVWDNIDRGIDIQDQGFPVAVNIGCVHSNPQQSWECIGGKWGYIGSDGRSIIPVQFDTANNFDGDVASVKVGNKFGLIDKMGKFIVNPIFDEIRTCQSGLHTATENGKFGYIDSAGRFSISPQFAGARCFLEGLAPVAFETSWNGSNKEWKGTGAIDSSGKLIVNPVWKDLTIVK